MTTCPGKRDPPVGEGKKYRFGEPSRWAMGRKSGWGEPFPRARFYIFFLLSSFSFLCFPDYFISFSFVLQIDSNQFLKFAKIQSNNLGQ
jgi:hypothetical protein